MIISKVVLPDGGVLFSVSSDELPAFGFSKEDIDNIVVNEKWSVIRSSRDRLVSLTDWTQMPDAPLDDAKKAEFTAYRQALRDIPQTYSDPDAVVWPEKPTV